MDRPRYKPPTSLVWTSRAMTGLGIVTAIATPVVVVGAWLLMTDPAMAADLAATGDPWPLVQAIADALGEVMRRVLRAF
jgi:hypothetical protein